MINTDRTGVGREIKTDELKAVREKPNPDLIEYIEYMLDEAKSGDIQGLVTVKVFSDGKSSNGWSLNCNHSAASIIGELHMAITAVAISAEGVNSSSIIEV